MRLSEMNGFEFQFKTICYNILNMKLLLSNNENGFSIPKCVIDELNIDDEENINRGDISLVKEMERYNRYTGKDDPDIVVVEIPDNIEYIIMEYNGYEWAAEQHQRFGCYRNYCVTDRKWYV